jgi:RNA polymerase sigma-70 factor (ECF subfamily)
LFARSESDAQLVARTRQGDVEAFNHLVLRWEKRLYNYLLRVVSGAGSLRRPRAREDALDLTQDAFLKAYQSIGTLADAEKFPAWLYRIAHNLAFSHLRRPVSVGLDEERNEQQWTQEWPRNWTGNTTSYRVGPTDGLERELELAVSRSLEALPDDQREAIVLKVYHGFRFDEIAEIISCPVSTVKTRVYAGFVQLRQMLESEPSERLMPRRR